MRKNRKLKLGFILILSCCLALPTFATPPKVIKATPDNRETNVAPSTNEITIHFDQAMSTSGYSICGGGPNFPKTIGKVKWVGNDTVVLKVQLEPNHKYELSVNCPSYQNFKSRNGEPAIIYPITFETGSVGSSSGGKFSNKTIISKLHEAIYAEETEGDLDKAIGLYEQVIDQASEVERIAAKATYKIGGCYLKKGDKESAVKYFQSVVEKYPSQTAYFNQAKEQLDKIAPAEKELPLFAQVPSDVLGYLSGQYAVIAAEGNMKNLKFNNHIYYVSPELKLFRGGYGYYQQSANSSTPERICISGTTYPDQSFYDAAGNKMEIEIEDRPGEPGYYDIYWKPAVEIPAGQPFYYGWCRNKSKQLNSIANTNTYPVTMQNQYGSPVLEVFFLVLPEGFAVAEQSETFTKKETVASFDIYQWKKEVPTSTNHIVNITLNYGQVKETVLLKDSFEEGTDTPNGWTKGNNVDGVEYIWDKNNASDGMASLCLKKTANRYFPIAQWTKEIKYQTNAQQLCVSAQVKAMNTSKAILDALFLDENGKWIKHQWVSYIGEKKEENLPPADHDWKKYSGTVDIPENTKTIVIGLQIYGPGTVWFDDLEVAYLTAANKNNNLIAEDKQISLEYKKQAEDLTSQGWKLWGERKLAEAEEIFKQAIAKNPEAENAYQGLGWAQFNQGKKFNATDSFEKCIELNPKNAAALNGLGWIADGQGNKDEAIKWWEKAVDASNGNATASLSGLTKVYMEKGDYENAIKYYQMWLKAEPDNKDAKEGLKKAEEEIEKLKTAVKSAIDWLDLIDKGSYGESWEQAASFFKSVVTQSQWEVAAKAAREPLGKLISREVLTKTYIKQVPGGPDGEYVIITFKASFENKDSAIETVTPMLDNDGKWKVSGYYIN